MKLLTPKQREQWEARGFVLLPQALESETVRELTRWVEEIEVWSRGDGPGLHHFEQTDRGPRIARSENFDPHHPGISGFMRGGTLAALLAELLGEPAVLFKEKINYKYPGGGGFFPHQDASAYHFADHHISCMVPLDSATVESGCLWFASDRQEGLLPNQDGRISEAWLRQARWEPVEVTPGDLVFFDSYAPHKSDTNRSDSPRRLIYLTYNAASKGDLRETYYRDKRAQFEAAGDEGPSGHVLMSINDDFLGLPVDRPTATPPAHPTQKRRTSSS